MATPTATHDGNLRLSLTKTDDLKDASRTQRNGATMSNLTHGTTLPPAANTWTVAVWKATHALGLANTAVPRKGTEVYELARHFNARAKADYASFAAWSAEFAAARKPTRRRGRDGRFRPLADTADRPTPPS